MPRVRASRAARIQGCEGRFTGASRVTSNSLYFVQGERRVVYASRQVGRWSTDCARTALVLRAADQELEDITRCGS
jgi:hypothetical protein